MVKAYLRVSKHNQDCHKFKADILKLANERKLGHVEFVEEHASSRVCWRDRAIGQIIGELAEGDVLIVPEMSRIGRSMLEIMHILNVCMERGIRIYAVKGNWSLDDTIQSKVLAFAFSLAAEIERDLISQRTKEGLAAVKAKGVKLGRPRGIGKSKLDPHTAEIKRLLSLGATQVSVAKRFGTSAVNLHLWLKKHHIAKNGTDSSSKT